MKAWQKGAIVGAVWGLISVLFIMAGVTERPKPPPVYYYVISAPAWILIIIVNKIFGVGIGELLFIFSPIIWAIIGGGVGHLYEERKKLK